MRKPAQGTFGFTVLLGAIISLQLFGVSITLPALPSITSAIGGNAELAQLTISAYLVGAGVSQFVYGALADSIGRKPTLLGGLALYAATSVACAFASSIDMLIALRVLQGVGATSGMVVSRAIVRDLFEGEAAVRMMGRLGAFISMVPLLAPLVGGAILAVAGWRGIFGLLAAVSAAMLAISSLWLRESIRVRDPQATDPRRLAANAWRFLRTPGCAASSLVLAFSFGGLNAYSVTSSFVLIGVFGISSAWYGFFLSASAGFVLIGSLVSSRLAARLTPRRALRLFAPLAMGAGLVVLAGTLTGLRGPLGIAVFIVPMMAYGFALGILFPNAMAEAMQPVPDIAGVASATAGTLQMTVAAIFVWLGGRFFDGTPLSLGLCVAAGGVFAFVASRYAARGSDPPATTR